MSVRICTACGATNETIARDGHYFLDRQGRPSNADTPNVLPCPESCTCIPECFSRAEHDGREFPASLGEPTPTVTAAELAAADRAAALRRERSAAGRWLRVRVGDWQEGLRLASDLPNEAIVSVGPDLYLLGVDIDRARALFRTAIDHTAPPWAELAEKGCGKG